MSGNRHPDAWPSGLVIIDKPGGMTSHDVVARVRRLARTRRVGHAGTLDPMATGVLVIGTERATRLLGHLTLTEKTYEATIRLGRSTTTDDAEGEPTGGSAAAGIPEAALQAEIAKLTGEILQVPSSVSAIKVNGQRAYKLTRAGEAPELAARPVTVYEFTVTGIRPAGDCLDVDARVRCSSGTYIRALARDLGTALGTGGHLTALRRTAVGPYTLAQAHTLNDLENRDQSAERLRITHRPEAMTPAAPGQATRATRAALHDPSGPVGPQSPAGTSSEGGGSAGPPGAPWVIPLAEAAATAFPRLDLTADEARRLAQGARLPLPGPAPAAPATGSVAHSSASSEPPSASKFTGGSEPPGASKFTGGSEPAGGSESQAEGAPVAAFAPDGTLVALVTAERGQLRSLAVFAGQQ